MKKLLFGLICALFISFTYAMEEPEDYNDSDVLVIDEEEYEKNVENETNNKKRKFQETQSRTNSLKNNSSVKHQKINKKQDVSSSNACLSDQLNNLKTKISILKDSLESGSIRALSTTQSEMIKDQNELNNAIEMYMSLMNQNFDYAEFKRKMIIIVPVFYKYGKKIQEHAFNPLIDAVCARDYDLTELFLKHGASPTFRGINRISGFDALYININLNVDHQIKPRKSMNSLLETYRKEPLTPYPGGGMNSAYNNKDLDKEAIVLNSCAEFKNKPYNDFKRVVSVIAANCIKIQHRYFNPLRRAVEARDFTLIQDFLSNGLDPHFKDRDGHDAFDALYLKANKNDLFAGHKVYLREHIHELLQKYSNQPPKIYEPANNDSTVTALYFLNASKNVQYNLFRELMETVAPILGKKIQNYHFNPLARAVKARDPWLVELLLKNSADPHFKDFSNKNAYDVLRLNPSSESPRQDKNFKVNDIKYLLDHCNDIQNDIETVFLRD